MKFVDEYGTDMAVPGAAALYTRQTAGAVLIEYAARNVHGVPLAAIQRMSARWEL